jgi:hypothetical protein
LRKQHKRTLTELLATLKEANAELPKPENTPIIGEWVKSIKEFAEVIKNYISVNVSNENESKENAMRALDIYAEKLSIDIDQTLFNSLKQQIHNIEIEINKFRVTHFEVVFIVSSAAKSDSLLPVYEAAVADLACIAHWMPVPLKKFNPDQKIIGEDFDGPEKYPGIECTNYGTYNFEQSHPDVIFTNDIYDGGNFISVLPPYFWATNLKKFTDCLVYIPYFTLSGKTVDKSFLQYESMLFVDLVIVETEKARKLYVEAAMEIFKDEYNYKRIVSLGSPKYDRAMQLNKMFESGDLEIPDEWRKKIYNPDGSKKTVIFFNTSLNNLLTDVRVNEPQVLPGSDYLVMVRTSIEMLSQNDNIVLLWRPHPLFMAALTSMRPWLCDKWQQLVNDFINRDLGIYDDGEDLNMSIAMSDALYGDKSSISNTFVKMNKNLIGEYGFGYIHLVDLKWFSAVRCCGELYIKSNFTSPILKFNTNTRKMHFVEFFEGEPLHNEDYHMFSVSHNEKIYYLPANCKDLAIYDPKTNIFEHFELDLDYPVSPKLKCNMYFRNGFFYQDKLYLIPAHYNAIISYDFTEKKQETCLDISGILSEISYSAQEYYFINYAMSDDNTVILPFLRSNDILIYNLSDNTYKLRKVGVGSGFADVFKYKENLILIELARPIIWFLDKNCNVISCFNDFPSDFTYKEKVTVFSFLSTTLVNNNLFLFSLRANMSLKLDLETMKCERIAELDKYNGDLNQGSFVSAYYDETAKKIYITERIAKHILEFDPETNAVNEISIKINELYDDETISYFTNRIINEVNSESNILKYEVKPCAEDIYNYIKDQVFL